MPKVAKDNLSMRWQGGRHHWMECKLAQSLEGECAIADKTAVHSDSLYRNLPGRHSSNKTKI